MGASKSNWSSLQFVSVNAPAQSKDVAQRKAVRKHVMRRFWGQIKNQGQSQEDVDGRYPHRSLKLGSSTKSGTCSSQEPCLGNIDRIAARCSQCRAVPSIGLENNTQDVVHAEDPWTTTSSSPRALLGPGYRDPFGSYPILTQPYTEFLLQHYIINLSPSMSTLEIATNTTNPILTILVPLAISDPAVFHSLICFIAAHNSIFGDYQNHERHAEGLDQVVSMRGGLMSFPSYTILYGMIIWVEMLRGLYSNPSPRHHLPNNSSQITTISSPINSLQTSTPFTCPPSEKVLSNDCISMMLQLREMTKFIESCRSSSITSSARTSFYDERGCVEYHLVVRIAETANDPSRAFEHCTYLAASIYHHAVIRPLCIWSGVQCTLLDKLRPALLMTDLAGCWGRHVELLLWIMMTAVPAAIEGPMKSWLVEMLRRILDSFTPKLDVNGIKNILRKFLWCENISGPACDAVLRHMELRN